MEVESEGVQSKVTDPQPEEKPPERKDTFKDKVMGASKAQPAKICNLVKERIMKLDLVERNKLFPIVSPLNRRRMLKYVTPGKIA